MSQIPTSRADRVKRIGMALGFAYFVIDNAALAMGDFGGYPPFLAAWAPFLLFLMIGETVLVRTEE